MTTMTSDRGMTSSMPMSMGGMMPSMIGMPGMGMPMGMMPQMPMMGSMMSGMMSPMSMGMMPRCMMTMKKTDMGMQMTCVCDDKVSAAMLQNLCMMMPGAGCSTAMMMNGMMCCCCNMACMGACKCEMMDMGVMMTCTSGDASMVKMMHACCDCMTAMMTSGMMCCMMMNGMPVCCMVC